MTESTDRSCGCPPAPHPRPPEIPAGLATLALRQLAGFPEYRDALLKAIVDYPALTGWGARTEGDLGVMLLEAWAYVLDIVGFYDARIAERSYLPTAPDAVTAARISSLVGHRPRPAMAASVQLALTVDGKDPLALPTGIAFRSGPFDDEPPQVFELTTPATVWPERNRFELAPVRATYFDGTLRLGAGGATAIGSVIHLASANEAAAARLIRLDPDVTANGEPFQRATLEDATSFSALSGQRYDALRLSVFQFSAGESDIESDMTLNPGTYLDGYYPQLRAQQPAAVEVNGQLHAVTLTQVVRDTLYPTFDTTPPEGTPTESTALVASLLEGARPRVTVTRVQFDPDVTREADDGFRLYALPRTLRPPFRPAKTVIELADLQSDGALRPPIQLGDAPTGGAVIARGQRLQGALIPVEIDSAESGRAMLRPGEQAKPFEPLTVPVEAFGNVVTAVRGETVSDEVLGSGDATQAFSSFTLKKSPLAWVEAASQPDGRRPELTVRVDGIAWRHVPTFFGTGPDDQVFTLRPTADGKTRVVFGDGARGARPASGVDNIRCTYRFGAGAKTPPPGYIDQVARPMRRLASVRGPLPCVGGADPESTSEIRQSGPEGALTLGRAVSLPDFVALARSFSGVINAAATWIWDERRQRAAVKVWTISSASDVSTALAPWLAQQATVDLTIVAEPASVAEQRSLAVTVRYRPMFDPALVQPEVEAALFDFETGLLSPKRQSIGGALFRSQIVERIHRVEGVDYVESLLLDGSEMPPAVGAPAGGWFDLEDQSTVSQ